MENLRLQRPNTHKNVKHINSWISNLEQKTRILNRSFLITITFGIVCMLVIVLFSRFELTDILILILLLISIWGCSPYIEVATRKNKNSFFASRLTFGNWKNELVKKGQYNILSSNIHFMQPFFPIMSVLSFLLFTIHKVIGSDFVSLNTVVLLLLIQIPFNNMGGFNPIGIALTRQRKSQHVTQDELKSFLKNNSENRLNLNRTRPPTALPLALTQTLPPPPLPPPMTPYE